MRKRAEGRESIEYRCGSNLRANLALPVLKPQYYGWPSWLKNVRSFRSWPLTTPWILLPSSKSTTLRRVSLRSLIEIPLVFRKIIPVDRFPCSENVGQWENIGMHYCNAYRLSPSGASEKVVLDQWEILVWMLRFNLWLKIALAMSPVA